MDTLGEWVIPYDRDDVRYVIEDYDAESNDATCRAILPNGEFSAPFRVDYGALVRVV